MEKPSIFFSEQMKFYEVETKDGVKDYYAEGYISTHDLDLVNDIVTPECMADMLMQLNNRNIKCDLEHESWRGETDFEKEINKTIIPMGRFIEAKQDSKGIFVKELLNKANSRFVEAWESMKNGFLDAYSIAYVPIKVAYKEINGKTTRLLEKVHLLNVAHTGNPANPNARMTNVFMKSLEMFADHNGNIHHLEVGSMEEKKTADVVVKTLEAPAKAESAEAKSLEKLESLEKEMKSIIEAKDKSIAELKEIVSSLKNEVTELKKFLDEPQFKAKQEDMKAATESIKATSVGPLDAIN